MSDTELSEFYQSQPFSSNLYVSDLKRESDAEFLSDAFIRGNARERRIICDYIIEKRQNIITQEILMELYFGGTYLRKKFLKSLASNVELPTIFKYKIQILSESNGKPWAFLDLVARVSKWKYLMEIGKIFSETTLDNSELRYALEHHYYKTIGALPLYTRDPTEKLVALQFIRGIPVGVLPAQLLKRIEFDAK